MESLFVNGYTPRLRPSGHDISNKFGTNNGGAIPPNLISLANTESNSTYIRYCTEHNITPHPARFPIGIPEFFIRMLTDKGDIVLDPFAGSCVTGEASEKTQRRWICCDTVPEYLQGALGRFQNHSPHGKVVTASYNALSPGSFWNGVDNEEPLPPDGGKERR